METNRMRNRGFLKGKLVPFYRSPKPSSTMQYTTTTPTTTTTTKVKPSPSPASVGYVVHEDYVNIAQPKTKVTFVVADNNHDLVGQLEAKYGMVGDESVDTKAAVFISAFQERLKHEQVNSERSSFNFKTSETSQVN